MRKSVTPYLLTRQMVFYEKAVNKHGAIQLEAINARAKPRNHVRIKITRIGVMTAYAEIVR